jgi:putative oxidoreductase
MTDISLWSDRVLRTLLVALFTIAGAMKLTAHPFEIHGFEHFGYAPWFMYLIGALEFLGAFALLHRRTLLPAAGLMAVILVGAVYSHINAGDPLPMTIPALVALGMTLALMALHRRPARMAVAA